MPKLKSIHLYPAKSMHGFAQSSAEIALTGLKNDRVVMLSTLDGVCITARTHPILLTIRTEIDGKKITFYLPNGSVILVHFSEFSAHKEPTNVWGSHFSSYLAPATINQLFSDFLNEPVQLRWIGQTSDRFVEQKPTVPIAFFDEGPFLLLNQASFELLQKKCPEKLVIEQFRGNLIIDDADPFAEDEWLEIQIGDILFEVIKPCDRCNMVMINPFTLHFSDHKEPLTTLSQFRKDEEGNLNFGLMLMARNQGAIHAGDPVAIVKTQAAKRYVMSDSKPKKPAPDIKRVTITYQDKSFSGNTHNILLEQCETAGISIPYGCRVGICGHCRTHLISGKVEPKTKSAIKENGDILPCSCVPLTDLKLEPLESTPKK